MPRQLYFDAKPVHGLELQYGFIGINRGDNSEITSYDDDGYMDGGRLIVRKPNYLFFDELSATYGYLGDITTPDVIDRYQHLDKFNYHQFLLRKKITKWLDVSADYTWQIAHTLREAAYVKTKPVKIADAVRVELYQRFNSIYLPDAGDSYPSGSGFAVTAEKSSGRKSICKPVSPTSIPTMTCTQPAATTRSGLLR